MSLINDALKRAADAQKRQGDLPPGVPLQPVDYGGRPSPVVRLLAFLLILSLIAVAGFFFVKWNQALDEQEASTTAMARMVEYRLTSSAPAQVVQPTPAPVVQPTPAEIPPPPLEMPIEPARIRVSTNVLIRTNWVLPPTPALPDRSGEDHDAAAAPVTSSPEPVGVPGPVSAPQPPVAAAAPESPATSSEPRLRLQSIIYRLKNPAAVINGEMVVVGDRLKEGRVLRIDRYSVTVEWRGETNELTLPRL